MPVEPIPAATPLTVIEHKLNFAADSLSLDAKALRALLELLQQRCFEAEGYEVANFRHHERLEDIRRDVHTGFTFFVTVSGHNGVQLNGSVADIFDSPRCPADIATVFVDSTCQFRQFNYTPRNSVVLFLDFRRPAVFDFNLLPSLRTENGSNIVVRGVDATWVKGVFHEVQDFASDHRATGRWVHKGSIWDALLWFLFAPVTFWWSYRLDPWISKIGTPFLRAAIYTYVFIALIFIFRAAFHYARWSWPLVEFRHPGSSARAHRTFWALVTSSLLLSLAYDLLKLIVN